MPHPGGQGHGLAEVGTFWRDYETTWETARSSWTDAPRAAGLDA
jgi:hypothetical protein